MIRFDVFNALGQYVQEGDKLTSFRGESYTFVDCAHPRKIYVKDSKGRGRELYPSVFDVRIEEV